MKNECIEVSPKHICENVCASHVRTHSLDTMAPSIDSAEKSEAKGAGEREYFL